MQKVNEYEGQDRVEERKYQREKTGEGQAEDDGSREASELTACGSKSDASE